MKKPQSFSVSLAFAMLLICNFPALAQTQRDSVWTGQVIYVIDGDSMRVRPIGGGKPVNIRLRGIDAPEICQLGGVASRDALSGRLRGQRVRVSGKARDSYGRLVAQLDFRGDDLSAWMVMQGHAWSYRYRGENRLYAEQQRQAQRAGRGLFARSDLMKPEYPGDFRKQHGPCRR